MKEELGSSLKIKGFGKNDKYIFKGRGNYVIIN
jgi:hypothetical protein